MPRAQRERLILEIAGQVFARDGYHAGSMDEIARLAGVSKPMLYAYFSSKEGLYLAYIERSGQELLERLQGTFVTGGSPQDQMRERVSGFLEFVEEHRDGWTVLFREASANRPVAEHVAELRGRIATAIARMVSSEADERVPVEPTAAEAIGHAVVGAGESLANWWLEHPEVARRQVAEWHVAMIAGTIAAVTRGGR